MVTSDRSDRKKLGFLEKHKDYVLRAKDFHKKEKAIQVRLGPFSFFKLTQRCRLKLTTTYVLLASLDPS